MQLVYTIRDTGVFLWPKTYKLSIDRMYWHYWIRRVRMSMQLDPDGHWDGLDPYKHLTWMMEKANNADLTDAKVVLNLLPWNATAEYQAKMNMITPALKQISEPECFLHS